MKKSYASDLTLLPEIARDIDCFCDSFGVSKSDAFAINLVVEELFTNSVTYGFKGDTSGEIEVLLTCQSDGIKILMSDSAPKFNPFEQAESPDLSADVDERKIGGLGVFFVRKQMNNFSYAYENSHNVITMFRKFSK